MQKTSHFNLNQWEPTDPIRREDFNADNAAIDAALASGVKIKAGSYVGTGTYGRANPNSLTFDFEPKMVLILGFDHDNSSSYRPGLAVLINGFAHAAVFFANSSSSGGTADSGKMSVTFSGNTVSYYAEYRYAHMNYSGNTYYYLAIG